MSQNSSISLPSIELDTPPAQSTPTQSTPPPRPCSLPHKKLIKRKGLCFSYLNTGVCEKGNSCKRRHQYFVVPLPRPNSTTTTTHSKQTNRNEDGSITTTTTIITKIVTLK